MTIAVSSDSRPVLKSHRLRGGDVGPTAARALLALAIGAALAAGLAGSGNRSSAQAIANAGADLTRLLRAMAALKAAMAGCAVGAIVWRLGAPVTVPWLAAYGLACAVMAAGVGLIWNLSHIGVGAFALHAGLLSVAVLFWRDPAVTARLARLVADRRRSIASRED